MFSVFLHLFGHKCYINRVIRIFCFGNGVILQDNVTNYLEVQTDVLRVNAPIYVIDY